VDVEIDANNALPWIEIIWLPDASIKESKERIRATFRNCWVRLPARKIVLNLAPSHIKKIWTRFDLPLAVAILALVKEPTWFLKKLLETSLFFGELGLDGSVKKVYGILPSVISAYQNGRRNFFVPEENIPELEYIPNINLYSISSFEEVIWVFDSSWDATKFAVPQKKLTRILTQQDANFWDIQWQLVAKRALTIAAAWMHNVLMVWPPWSGKTMLAKSLGSVLPPLTFEQTLEVSQIYSVLGNLSKNTPLIRQRPFRVVHHTASKVSIIGWGRNLTPWEVSLAHHGILFFDELPEFPREVLEVLRQPLEDKKIVISRVSGSVQYPSNFMFVAAMNPCQCWFYKDKQRNCVCSINEIKRYQSKISGPLLDRFDIMIEIPRENIDVVMSTSNQDDGLNYPSITKQAREIQKIRYKDTPFFTNAHISSKVLRSVIVLEPDAEVFLKDVVKRMALSPRVAHKLIKLGRTIADLQKKKTVEKSHIAEALQFRKRSLFLDS